jgi:hypothetical protein
MTPIEEFLAILININFWNIAKILVLLALSLYFLFALMIVREVNLMNRTLIGVFNLPVRIIAWLHLIFSLVVFSLALVIL